MFSRIHLFLAWSLLNVALAASAYAQTTIGNLPSVTQPALTDVFPTTQGYTVPGTGLTKKESLAQILQALSLEPIASTNSQSYFVVVPTINAQPQLTRVSGLSNLYLPLTGGTVTGPTTYLSQLWAVGGAGTIVGAQIGPTTLSTGDQWTNPNSLMLGGQVDMASYSETIRCLPYGPLDIGTCLSIVASDRPLAGTRAGVSPNFIVSEASYGNFDEVNEFNEAGTAPPRMSICSTCTVPSTPTYTAGMVTFNPPLNAAQVGLLRQNMHIMTNSVEPNCPAQGNGPLPICTYGGQIILGGPGISWDVNGGWIKVDGWVVLGSGNSATNQIPPAVYDTVMTNLGVPALFVGVYTKSFGRNTLCSLDPTLLPSDVNNPLGNVNTQVYQCEGEELDLLNYAKAPYIESLHGITVAYSAINYEQPTNDSYDMWLSCGIGDTTAMPTCLKLTGVSTTGALIDGDEFLVNGTISPPETVGAQHMMQDQLTYLDGDTFHIRSYIERDVAAFGDTSTSLHFGLWLGSSLGAFNGTHQGEIVFNKQGYYSGVSVVGYYGKGVNVDANGDVTADGVLVANSPTGTGLLVTANTILDGTLGVGGAANFTGGTVTIGTASSVQALAENGPAGYSRPMWWETNGVLRWQIGANNTSESGSNVGSDFDIDAYTDGGGASYAPAVRITRSTGAFTAYFAANFPGGTVTVGTNSSVQALVTNGPSGYLRPITWQSGGSGRWSIGANQSAESGSNVGSDFDLDPLSDSGSAVFSSPALRIFRATANVQTIGHLLENNNGTGPSVSNCGSGTNLTPGASDMRFVININGTTSSCTITFSESFASSALSVPVCSFVIQNTNAYAYLAAENSNEVIIDFSTALGAGAYVYGICRG